MSKINGEKARASIESRRRTAQREKDRAKKAEIAQNAASHPAAKKKSDAK
jgi:hypothetical protein